MLQIPPILYRKRRRYKEPTSVAPAPPVALVLVAASYLTVPHRVINLAFDRAIDISSLDGSNISIDDAFILHETLLATGVAILLDPVTVQIRLFADGAATGTGIRLTATDATGIIAVDDGGAWVGVTNLSLPFP